MTFINKYFYEKHKNYVGYGTDSHIFSTVPYRTRQYGVPYRTHVPYSCLERTFISESSFAIVVVVVVAVVTVVTVVVVILTFILNILIQST